MAEERLVPKHEVDASDGISHDDMRALRFVLQHVRGASPSSMSPLDIEEYVDEA